MFKERSLERQHERFIQLSSRIHPEIKSPIFSDLFKELDIYAYLATNKQIVSSIRNFLLGKNIKLSQQATYEYLSQLAGEKDWNTASAKNIQFANLFNKLNPNKIRTLIPELDLDLDGGLPRKVFSVLIGSCNSGKTRFVTSIGCNALRQNLKVLHIALEGRPEESFRNYLQNLSKMDFKECDLALKNKEKSIKGTLNRYSKNLKIITMLDFNVTVEDIIERCEKVYEEFKFDVLIIDYYQLLCTREKKESYLETMRTVASGMKQMSEKFDCALISPVQILEGDFKNNLKRDLKEFRRDPYFSDYNTKKYSDLMLWMTTKYDQETKYTDLKINIWKNSLKPLHPIDKEYPSKTNFAQSNLIVI